MDIIYLLVSIAVVFILLVITVFFWAIRNGQFDDLEGPAYRILKDDDDISGKNNQDK